MVDVARLQSFAKKHWTWIPVLYILYVFLGSLPYKFTNSEVTMHIFSTIGTWMQTNFLSFMGVGFSAYGGYVIGTFELTASILLIFAATRHWGALLGLSLMSGAIFFHLITPLGIDVGDGGALFISASIVWVLCVLLIYVERAKLQETYHKITR